MLNKRRPESPKAARIKIWANTSVIVCNGLFACFDIETGGYFAAAISIIVMGLYLPDLMELWSRPCNSSR